MLEEFAARLTRLTVCNGREVSMVVHHDLRGNVVRVTLARADVSLVEEMAVRAEQYRLDDLKLYGDLMGRRQELAEWCAVGGVLAGQR